MMTRRARGGAAKLRAKVTIELRALCVSSQHFLRKIQSSFSFFIDGAYTITAQPRRNLRAALAARSAQP
jgi:hypothetical protein